MSRNISEDWLGSLPSQFRPERIVKENLNFYEIDDESELLQMPSCSVGSVAILRSNTPKMWMKSTTTWVLQTQPEAKVVNEDGS